MQPLPCLSAHGWDLDLCPGSGGAIAGLRWHEQHVLRPSLAPLGSPLDSACFPLVPYANRIANGRFVLDGTTYQLPRNFGDHPHSLHGVGWLSTWAVTERTECEINLAHVHVGNPDWPWPYRAEQRFTIAKRDFEIALTITNTGRTDMPAGLGLHPYFPCSSATSLTARSNEVLLGDRTMLPTVAAPADHFGNWADGASLAGDTLIDNAYDGWDGTAHIALDALDVQLEATGASAFHLYRPPGSGFFCFEPVTHLPDAINRGGMRRIGPGESLSLTMRLAVLSAR